MKICVLSDTHVYSGRNSLPEDLTDMIGKVDYIIHAGDFCSDSVYYELETLAPVIAVRGNNDYDHYISSLPEKRVFKAGDVRIGIIHGLRLPSMIDGLAWNNFFNNREKVHCIVYGHTHVRRNEKINNVLMFNPGSPWRSRSGPKSIGFLETDGEYISAKHVFYDKI